MMNSILVVGADRGIANAICRQLDARGDHVIAAASLVERGSPKEGSTPSVALTSHRAQR